MKKTKKTNTGLPEGWTNDGVMVSNHRGDPQPYFVDESVSGPDPLDRAGCCYRKTCDNNACQGRYCRDYVEGLPISRRAMRRQTHSERTDPRNFRLGHYEISFRRFAALINPNV